MTAPTGRILTSTISVVTVGVGSLDPESSCLLLFHNNTTSTSRLPRQLLSSNLERLQHGVPPHPATSTTRRKPPNPTPANRHPPTTDIPLLAPVPPRLVVESPDPGRASDSPVPSAFPIHDNIRHRRLQTLPPVLYILPSPHLHEATAALHRQVPSSGIVNSGLGPDNGVVYLSGLLRARGDCRGCEWCCGYPD